MSRVSVQRVVQWAFTLSSALLMLRVVDLRAIPRILASANALHLALAFLIALAHFFAGAWRWQQLMRLYGAQKVPYIRLCNLYIASFFVSSVLPGTITGDGLRIYGTRQDLGSTTAAFAIVLLERLLGICLLAIIGAVAWTLMPVHPLLRLALPQAEYILILLAGAGAIFWIGAVFWRAVLVKAYAWLGKLLQIIVQLPALIYARPLVVLRVLVGSLIYQALSILIIFEAMRSTGVPISLQVFLTVVPAVTVLLILPISVQGIGVRESLYLAFLVPYGLEPEPIIAGLALTYIIGVPFILWGWALFNGMYRKQFGAYHTGGAIKSNDTL